MHRPRELTHDAQVYRAYLKDAGRLREEGAFIRRVVLDHELKREYQQFLQERNRGKSESDGRPDRTPEEIHRWAVEHELPDNDGHVQFPDARIEDEDRDGHLRTLDIEVETLHYRGAHASSKASSGFSLHSAGSARVVGSRSSGGGGRAKLADSASPPAPLAAAVVAPFESPPRLGPVAMNLEHAVQPIAKRRYTDRQARFLVLVARHSGVCVMRQYPSFAGIVFGQKTRKFFANLVRLGFVSTYDCAHNRGRVYHVRHRAIYEAIGEPDSRLRRPPGVPRALERLMLLDAILENPESIWMSSSTEKLGYLASRGISADDAPHLSIRQGDQRRVRHFPDRLPIGVHPSGHVVVVYLHADPMHDEFRHFLQRHAPLLERLPAWTIRIVVPAHLEGAVQDLQKVAWGQLASPVKEPIFTQLRWYFERFASPPTEASPATERARFEYPPGLGRHGVEH